MKLLTQEIIKNDTETRIEESQSRISDAAIEETFIMKKLNDTRELYAKETARLDLEIEAKRKELQEIIDYLKGEITELESRKIEALKPIEKLESEVQNRLELVKNREYIITIEEGNIIKKEEEIIDRAEALDDYKTTLDELQCSLADRAETIKSEELVLKTLNQELANKLVTYNNTVDTHNKTIREKQNIVAERESICAVRETEFSIKEKNLKDREILLSDRRGAFERAWQELEDKKKNYENTTR